MRNLIFFMHTSLDGFVATVNGELNWVKLDDAMFDFVGEITQQADAALYGRVTFEMMESYWPTAASQPNATKHDIEHSEWYSRVPKIVLSRTLKERDLQNVTVISDDLVKNINKIKNLEGNNIVIFGSPSAANSLLNAGLVDEFWLFVNPILLGKGIPLFEGVPATVNLKLSESKLFDAGVIALHYTKP